MTEVSRLLQAAIGNDEDSDEESDEIKDDMQTESVSIDDDNFNNHNNIIINIIDNKSQPRSLKRHIRTRLLNYDDDSDEEILNSSTQSSNCKLIKNLLYYTYI